MVCSEYFKKENGAIALLLATIIMSVIFVISAGMAIVRITEIKLASNVSDSTIAYQAADNGIEYALNEIQGDSTGSTINSYSICPNKESSGFGKYCLELDYADGDVVGIKSIGEYRNTKRAVEAILVEDAEEEIVDLTPQTFNYTGGQQTFVVPNGVTSMQVDAYGAKGGGSGGSGGKTSGIISVTSGETLYIYVGGQGGSGGYNGGGSGAYNGGGASDIRRGGTGLTNRVIVASGGGGQGGEGAGYAAGVGGGGGGENGDSGSSGGGGINGGAGGSGGTQSAGGSSGGVLGIGGNGVSGTGTTGGGGGGGYYGGGGGGGGVAGSRGTCGGFGNRCGGGGGGGGSAYVLAGGSTSSGINSGNGYIVITPISPF